MNVHTAKQIGGKVWQYEQLHRVYFSNLDSWYGFELTHYKTGNLQTARLDGELISNCKAKKVLATLAKIKIWLDVPTGKLWVDFQYDSVESEMAASKTLTAIKAAAAKVRDAASPEVTAVPEKPKFKLAGLRVRDGQVVGRDGAPVFFTR